MIKLVHFYSTLHLLGGVERILHYHLERDAEHGLDSVVVIPFRERLAPVREHEKVIRLGLRGWNNMRTLRREFAVAAARFKPEIAVYHNLWGARWVADVDGASRRIAQLHTDSEISRKGVERSACVVDGLLGVSATIKQHLQSVFRDVPDGTDRVRQLDYPAEAEGARRSRSWPEDAPLLLGYCGRLVRQQKRVDRLPGLIAALRQAKIPFAFEVLGEGAEEEWLRGALAGFPEVQFLGRKSGAEYGAALSRWDAIVNCSDYEGTPISLLEALSCGVLPIYPRIGSGGEKYVETVDGNLLYAADSAVDFVRAVRILTAWDKDGIAKARQRACEAVSSHSVAKYMETFANFCAEILSRPPARHTRARPPSSGWSKCLPIGLAGRIDPSFIY